MRRREVLTGAGALALAGCAQEQSSDAQVCGNESFNWKMVTTWPPNFPGMGTGVARMVKQIETASGGRLKIKVYAAGELVPAFEVFDTVSRWMLILVSGYEFIQQELMLHSKPLHRLIRWTLLVAQAPDPAVPAAAVHPRRRSR